MTNKNASKLKLIKIIIKLLPIIINFKRDRKEWVKREGKNVDENKYRKHAQQALKIFIQLGPSYIKLGQWLSSRSDILPQPYLEVFATLQDDVPVESFEKVKKIIEEGLGIYEEMDYIKEAENLLAIKKNLAKEKKIIIPNVILDRTSKHIITTEYEPGIKITDVETLDKKGIDRQKLVILIHHVFFKMLLRNNIFHSDPHPGNIAVKDDGSVILYDFGMVGRLDNETRLLLIRLYLGLIDKDPVRTVDVLYQLGTLDYTTNRNIIEKAIELSIRSMHGKHVDKMEVKSLMDLSNKTLSKFPFRLPKYLALYMRMTSIVEGIYHQHQIKFQFVKVLSNLFEQEGLIKEAYIEEIKHSFQKFVKNIEASANLSQTIKTYLDNQETNIKKTDRHYTFLGKSIFASALFVGSAFLFSYNPIISSIGFICSIMLFIFSIIKK